MVYAWWPNLKYLMDLLKMKKTRLLKLLCLLIPVSLMLACENESTTSGQTAHSQTNAATIQESEISNLNQDQQLAAFLEEVFERGVSESPEFQSYLGREDADNAHWDDYSEEFAIKQNEQTRADLNRLLNEFEFDELSESSQISYQIFEYNQKRDLRNFEWRKHGYAVTQMNNIAGQIPTFLQNINKISSKQDAEDYISRISGAQVVLQAYVRELREGEAIGVIPPKMVYPKVLFAAENMLKGAPFEESADDGVLLADFRGKVDALEMDPVEREILINDAANALSGSFRSGYQELIAELTRLQAIADTDNGVWSLPNGEAYYANRVQNWTTTQKTVEEIHQLGLAEVARIRAEMQQVMKEVGFEGSMAEFFEYVRNNPDNYFPDTDAGREAYISEATALIDSIYDIADDYFNVLPKAPLEVRRVEPWREAGSSTAFYNGPAPDGSRPGIYYVNLMNMDAVQKHIMNSLAYHEGAPGHHFQIAVQQELEGIPEFRKFGGYSAYSEGWALYAERLAFEAGLYEGLPMRNFGRLSEEMKRAVRLVVDTGMHAKQWPLEQSIQYMTDNTPMAPADIERQIKRYYVLPGQALSYKVGMLTILDLRQRAKDQLGEQFDIREFHDVVLKNGAMPMEVLEQVVDNYISGKSSGA
jgi:uncharacterized protein (DUF885 family)